MVDKVLASLIASPNEAADDVLLEAMRLGNPQESARALGALLDRKTPTGIFGLLRRFDELPNDLRLLIVERADDLYLLLPDAGRSDEVALRNVAIRLIAHGRLGQLCYVLTENLAHPEPTIVAAAVDGLVALARFVATETRRLQSGKLSEYERKRTYRKLLAMRGEVEAAVYRAMDLHRGPKAADLLRAGLLLADSPQSRTMSILSTSRHGGVSPMVQRLQQSPDAEHVDAFLLGATHGQLRSQFAASFAAIDTAPVMDALLRRTHYLKDVRLEMCMRNVTRGGWWSEPVLIRDLARRPPAANAAVGPWIAAAGVHDVVQDEKLVRVLENVQEDLSARVALLRIATSRPQGASLTLLRRFLDDGDETLQRIAAREIVRRKPVDYSTVLLGLMKTAPDSVRRVASRAISAGAFDSFYDRFDKLDEGTRQRAGRAVFKLLPDAAMRLGRRLRIGTGEGLIKALTVTHELGVADTVRDSILALVSHEDPRVRSKAIAVAGDLSARPPSPAADGAAPSHPAGGQTEYGVPDLILDRALNDADARVRANAIEVLEAHGRVDHLPMLASRVRAGTSRERANAIKAMHSLKVSAAIPQLTLMLRDPRPEHRISALWAARQVGLYKLLTEVAQIARDETDPRVKRYALAAVRAMAAKFREAGAANPSGMKAG